jgi:hypothetical protein
MSNELKTDSRADLFLSYASEDRESIAKPLVRAIRRTGLSVWYDEIDAPLRKEGDHLPNAIAKMLHDAIMRSNQAWLLIGGSYRTKKWTRYEALSLSALSACGSADIGVIYHEIDGRELRRVLDDLRLEVDIKSKRVIRYADDPEAIAAHLLSFVEPRVSLVMLRQEGPIDVAIFKQLGLILLFPKGGLGGQGGAVAYDFCGHKIGEDANMNGLLGTFLEQSLDEMRSIKIGNAAAVGTISLKTDVTLGFLNHPNQDLYTPKEIKLGVVQNLGGLFLIPITTWGPVTIAQVTDDPPEMVQECVRMIKNAGIDEWSRIYFSDDGTFKVA